MIVATGARLGRGVSSSSALLMTSMGSRCAAAYLDDNYIRLHGRRTINEVNLLSGEWFDGLYADDAASELGA